MADALKRRQGLAAQLGASLYEITKDNAELRQGREGLFDGIAAIDGERARLQAEIDQLEAESAAQAQAAQTLTCPFCGTRVSATDLFCSGCGKPMADIQAAPAPVDMPAPESAPTADGPTCPSCAASVNEGDVFCMNCGTCLS